MKKNELSYKQLKDCYFNSEVLVVGIVRNDELFIPKGDTEFLEDDKAIFMGTPEGLDICANNFTTEKNDIKSVTIIGGGTVGFELAKSLEKNFKSLVSFKQHLIGAVVSTSKARAEQGSAGAFPQVGKFFGEFENLFFFQRKGFLAKKHYSPRIAA